VIAQTLARQTAGPTASARDGRNQGQVLREPWHLGLARFAIAVTHYGRAAPLVTIPSQRIPLLGVQRLLQDDASCQAEQGGGLP